MAYEVPAAKAVDFDLGEYAEPDPKAVTFDLSDLQSRTEPEETSTSVSLAPRASEMSRATESAQTAVQAAPDAAAAVGAAAGAVSMPVVIESRAVDGRGLATEGTQTRIDIELGEVLAAIHRYDLVGSFQVAPAVGGQFEADYDIGGLVAIGQLLDGQFGVEHDIAGRASGEYDAEGDIGD